MNTLLIISDVLCSGCAQCHSPFIVWSQELSSKICLSETLLFLILDISLYQVQNWILHSLFFFCYKFFQSFYMFLPSDSCNLSDMASKKAVANSIVHLFNNIIQLMSPRSQPLQYWKTLFCIILADILKGKILLLPDFQVKFSA